MATVNGVDCYAYYGTTGSTAASLLGGIQNASLNMGSVEVDLTVRGTNAKLTGKTIHDISFEFDLLYQPADGGWTALYAAYNQRTSIALLVCDGIKTSSSTRGVDADWVITQFTRNEPVDGKVTFSVVAKPTLSTRNLAFFVGS